ncbi:uncharacterized protein BP01DRAFT_375698 [Aspergillus saccharolyticus JOP 1030-1]|uniref:BTB domain-containing protein n=1 Tax=Aspergillus saccharolyticus JOP 1030-1 TaxID=1450539 RepID=A0A318Z7F0_9EURO|nr:hypothetical protein BP01DRAFT_375698 [Aspergillus saccharolyticus JOP 1030-1]PYH43086.1 hypothetical protein BP01DRAFT_375698 [Aspergillus saccharolyticus JOP 1030-1]
MVKKRKGRKQKKNNLWGTSDQTASRYLQAADNPVAEMDKIAEPAPEPKPEPVTEPEPLPELVLEGISEPVTVPEPEAVAQLCSEPIPEPLPEPVPEITDEAATASAVEQGDVADVPVTRDNGATEPGSYRAEEATGGPTTSRAPVLLEYTQPNISRKCYTITQNLVRNATTLPCHQDEDGSPLVRLPDVDEDIGHTIIHYLYTGEYQTVKPPSTYELPSLTVEYTRSIFAYRAARYMQIFDKDISIMEIISLGRKAFPRISEEPWFSEYLKARITASFEADEGIFQREQFFEGFGESLDFNKFLGKVMAQVYSSKISAIRYEAGLLGGDNTITIPNVDGEEIASSDCDISITRASLTEEDSHPETKPSSHKEFSLRTTALNGEHPSIGRSSDRDFDHRRRDYLDESVLSTNAEYDEARSSDVKILTPDSGTNIPVASRRPSYSRAELGPCLCPHWEVHSTDRNSWKGCEMCKSYLRRMFAALIFSNKS